MKLIDLEAFQTPEAAYAAKNHLEANGINAFISDAQMVGTDWQLGNTAVGGVKLQVSAVDVLRAQELLSSLEVEATKLGRHKHKHEPINGIRWYWWKETWGRPPLIIVIGTWLFSGTIGLTMLLLVPALFQPGRVNSGKDVIAWVIMFAILVGYAYFQFSVCMRTTRFYLHPRWRELKTPKHHKRGRRD